MSRSESVAVPRDAWVLGVGLLVLTALIYGAQLAVPPLSDDHSFLAAWRRGALALLRAGTVDSYPRVLRPMPAVLWGLSSLPGGFALVHAARLLAHAGCGWVIAWAARRAGKTRLAAFLCGGLFVALPLLGEAACWASAAPDVIAALLALLVLERWREGRGAAGTAALCAAAVLSKESVVALPLVGLVLGLPWRSRNGRAVWGIAAACMAARLWLFGGLGGYHRPGGTPLIDAGSALHTLLAALPYVSAVPLREPGAWLVPVILASAACAFALRPRRSELGPSARAAAACAVALIPALPVIGLSRDLSGGRFFYFPAAVLFLGLARVVSQPRRGRTVAAAALLVVWAACAAFNATAWIQAGRITTTILDRLRALAPALPSGAVIALDVPDMVDGAYVFRNGLGPAIEAAGVRTDVGWRRGTAADFDVAEIGGMRFIEPSEGRDWTRCERAARVAASAADLPQRLTAHAAGLLDVPAGGGITYLVLEGGDAAGWLLWAPVGEPLQMTRSRTFELGKRTPIRVDGARGRIGIRVVGRAAPRDATFAIGAVRVDCAPEPLRLVGQ